MSITSSGKTNISKIYITCNVYWSLITFYFILAGQKYSNNRSSKNHLDYQPAGENEVSSLHFCKQYGATTAVLSDAAFDAF